MIPDGVSRTRRCELDRLDHAVGRLREEEQHLVVVDRQPVRVDEVGIQFARDRRMRTQPLHPGFEFGTLGTKNLRAQAFTCYCS